MKIDFEKIINQTITTLVVSIVIGAAVITWRGATSVDDKVKKTKDDLEYLITSLSEKLANYETMMISVSNQLTMMIRNQSDLAAATRKTYMKPSGGLTESSNTIPKVSIETNIVILEQQQQSNRRQMMQQRDIEKQLRRKD